MVEGGLVEPPFPNRLIWAQKDDFCPNMDIQILFTRFKYLMTLSDYSKVPLSDSIEKNSERGAQ